MQNVSRKKPSPLYCDVLLSILYIHGSNGKQRSNRIEDLSELRCKAGWASRLHRGRHHTYTSSTSLVAETIEHPIIISDENTAIAVGNVCCELDPLNVIERSRYVGAGKPYSFLF